MEYFHEQRNFLDVMVIKSGNILEVDLLFKEIDTHQFLHIKSRHGFLYKNLISCGQAVRMKCI